MDEAMQIVQLSIPFIGYVAPALLLLSVVAVGDHIVAFLYRIVTNKRIRF